MTDEQIMRAALLQIHYALLCGDGQRAIEIAAEATCVCPSTEAGRKNELWQARRKVVEAALSTREGRWPHPDVVVGLKFGAHGR